ncbi:MAG: hypothetical protein OEY33_01390, partial [Bdellovibrionales bacterium]|nr:hypothetical protein [Bdellovibrionales bacterium]
MKLFFFFSLIFAQTLTANIQPKNKESKYRTFFGNCPSRTAGTLTLKLVKEFEKNRSLHDVKKIILKEELKDKHFIASYKINYDPLKDLLKFKFNCPKPLTKVQVYKDGGLDSYEAILVDDGELYDPTYEVILREEKKLTSPLPSLALPVKLIDKEKRLEITDLIHEMGHELQSMTSEIILDNSNELTVILSINGSPTSTFFGDKQWSE